MPDGAAPEPAPPPAAGQAWGGWLARLFSDPAFQARAARLPLIGRLVAREGAAMFDIVSGFVQSQALLALVELRVLEHLRAGPLPPETLAETCALPVERMRLLLQAGAALRLLRRRRDGRFALARRGAALLGVPGLRAMIDHHRLVYRDLADPVALLRGQAETELARFWPYVFGAAAAEDPATARRYSELMADSQRLVAQDTLAQARLGGVDHLLDVGGGTGAFARAAAATHPRLTVTVFDLPQVVAAARANEAHGAPGDGRVRFQAGSFRDDPLPGGAGAISLVRVLYDHDDATVAALLARAFAALPPRGRLVVSEPMGGGGRPEPAGDVYYAFYTLAMGTGRTRGAGDIAALLRAAGFDDIATPAPARPYVTRVVTARRPG